MKTIKYVGAILILLISFTGCKKEDTPLSPEEDPAEVSRARSVTFYSGRHRALLAWAHTDPDIVKTKVYWNSQSDSLVKEITPATDSVRVHIENLEEGDYLMEIFTFDKDGNRSEKALASGYVYGEVYNGQAKRIENVTYRNDQSLKIDWVKFDEQEATGSQVLYTHDSGATQTEFVDREDLQSVITDISPALRGTIRHRTVYAPHKLIIDTLYTEYTSISYANRAAVFDSLPGWKFRVKVLAEAKTISDYGGMPAFKDKMDEAFSKASKKFQVPGLNDAGNNEIHFYMTEIVPFEGTSGQFRYMRGIDDETLDLTVIVNDNAAPDDLSWGWLRDPYLTLGHDYTGLFGSNAIDALIHEFGHARGMYDLYLGEVSKASNNPISGQTYSSKKCIMNRPYGESEWSEFTRFIINESADKKVAVKYWNYFPDVFQVVVRQKDGTAAQGARINLYPVGHGTSSNTVRENDVIMYRGTTDASGSYDFDGNNPFAIDQNPSRNVYNFLVRIQYNGHTEYRWMPMDDALLAGSKGEPYILTVDMP